MAYDGRVSDGAPSQNSPYPLAAISLLAPTHIIKLCTLILAVLVMEWPLPILAKQPPTKFEIAMTKPAVGTSIKPPFAGPHLPIVGNKPPRGRRIAVASTKPQNDIDHPRVAKDLGPGPYRNEFGATCVALIQAKGFTLQVGKALNIPGVYRAAGYVVDGRIDDGAAFVTAESSYGSTNTGHTGIILDNSDPDYVYVQEQNYQGGHLTEGWVPRSSILAVVHL